MKTELRLFFKWGIEFGEEYVAEQHGQGLCLTQTG